MKPSYKKLLALLILLFCLFPLGCAVRKAYHDWRQPELNASLIAAVKKNDTTAVIAVLSQGADPNSKDLPSDTRSMWLRSWDCIRGRTRQVGSGTPALCIALQRDAPDDAPSNVPLITALLEAGATVNQPDDFGNTPLMWAVRFGQRSVVMQLLERGANTNQLESSGFTALHYATQDGDATFVQLLLDKGAKVDADLDDGRTPLWWAAVNGEADIVRILLANGSNVNDSDFEGDSPLLKAIESGHAGCVKLLLSKGARVTSINREGHTPLRVARDHHNNHIIKMLKEAGAKE